MLRHDSKAEAWVSQIPALMAAEKIRMGQLFVRKFGIP